MRGKRFSKITNVGYGRVSNITDSGVHTPRSYVGYLYTAKVFRAGLSPAWQIYRVLHPDCVISQTTWYKEETLDYSVHRTM